MKTFDDIKSFKRVPKNWGHMIKVGAFEDRMGSVHIRFPDGKSLYLQSDYDIDSTVGSMAEINGQYYIYDEYYSVAENPRRKNMAKRKRNQITTGFGGEYDPTGMSQVFEAPKTKRKRRGAVRRKENIAPTFMVLAFIGFAAAIIIRGSQQRTDPPPIGDITEFITGV